MRLRATDKWGSGAYGAPRGDHTHRGVDVVAAPSHLIRSLTYGTVSKIGWCYSQPERSHLRYVQVTLDGNRFRYFYCAPWVAKGDSVSPGDVLGIVQDLQPFFPGITDHYHFEIIDPHGEYVDPASMIPAIEEALIC